MNYHKNLQMMLSGIPVLGWIYHLLSLQELFESIRCVTYFIAWVLIVLTIAVSPPYYAYSARHYIYFFVYAYGYLSADTGYHLYHIGLENSIWENVHFGLCLILFVIAGTTPQPVHPLNLNECVCIKVCINGHKTRHTPEASASLFSWAVFQWINPLVRYGFSNQITREDLYPLTFQHRAKIAYEDYTSASKRGIRALYRLYKANERSIWLQIIFSNAAVLLSYLNPYFQQKFLEYIEKKDSPIRVAYGYVLMMFLAALVQTLCNSIQLWAGRRWNVRTLCMLDADIYAKALRRKDTHPAPASQKQDDDKEYKTNNSSKGEDNNDGAGKITNLMSLDANHIAELPAYIFMFYNAPVEIIIAMVYLYHLLGTAAIVGLAVLILFFPMTYVLVNKIRKAYMNISNAEDRRNNLLNEFLQGIRIIKYAAWETNWQAKIMRAREVELEQIRQTNILEVIMNVGYLTVPVLVSACSFVWYVKVSQRELSASVVFVSITLFDMLRSPLLLLPDALASFTQAYVSLKRITTYMDDQEIQLNTADDTSSPSGRVGFESSIFQWPDNIKRTSESQANDQQPTRISSNENSPLLEVTNSITKYVDPSLTDKQQTFRLDIPSAFDFPTGQLSLIYGPTGAGKSSLLNALLGEMDTINGKAYLAITRSPLTTDIAAIPTTTTTHDHYTFSNCVAYAAQQPFLLQATIRENILFGQPYEAERYEKVLWQCALVKDLSILPDGDYTEIGEKGISLSGGQKQRVSLARVVFSYSRIALLDDCLSAVDSHTARHIFEHCIRGDLLQGRTIIMVTHHIQLCMPAAKFLVRLEMGGKVAAFGSVEELQQSDKLIETNSIVEQHPKTHDDNDGVVEATDKSKLAVEQTKTATTSAGKLIQDEHSEKGQVKAKVYLTYLRACGGWLFWIALAVFFSSSRTLAFAENWWLRVWAAAYSSKSSRETPLVVTLYMCQRQDTSSAANVGLQTHESIASIMRTSPGDEENGAVDVDYYIAVYLLLCLAFVVSDALRNILLYWGSLRGAKILFVELIDRIAHAPLRFFDTTPCGRILNRFGADMAVVDKQVARRAGMLFECLTGMVASSIIISVITPQFIFVALVTACIYFMIGLHYLRASRELKRLNSVNRSPIYSLFTETLSGVTTIRAFGQQHQFLSSMYDKIDTYLTPYYLLWMVNRWLLVRMDAVGALMTLGAGVLILQNLDSIDAGMAGISLVYARMFLTNVFWMMRQYTEVEISMNSVERIQEYLEVEQEPRNQPKPLKHWPTTSALKISDLQIRYAPHLDPVLHGVSFEVKDKEKIGIVGRTGSGKSTLALSLFRFLEPSSGQIILDGINISSVDLASLRSSLTMIPQDAALFSGIIRSNLDPFNEHPDEALWTALERVHIRSRILGLNQTVSDGGQNFSQGQRQLLCMARALLRSSRLIVMDEATASVDFDMDAKIQHTIRQAFVESTLICVAHRLRTVIDYDRVLVMDNGRVVEYDTPWNLLNQTPPSYFRAMCEQSGELDTLINMARQTNDTLQQIKQPNIL
ncbi:hypothetical protein BDB00DRAFT_916046 [Zychaea mexicana]|uniref:uncharacterized protein n=1 Tax=Zychaea mexicana TaxID=64656 RepID=UPI0022FF2C1A|nr:uncharacterized protein BDB00DRAFT_916046 [Zychaea mexicana]KAI9490572.1 hypothetical protein BDB00DRAFT_916046 [Zychaea mexicana]